MIVLGINGWIERSHDAAACLVQDGKIVAAVEEERFIRRKRAYDCLPLCSVAWCLHQAGVAVDEIDLIAWGWDLPKLYELAGRRFEYSDEDLNQMLFPCEQFKRGKTIPVQFVSHHLAHAASAFYCSPFDEAAVVVIDGAGESQSSSIWKGKGWHLELLREFPVDCSLGFFYEAACLYLGFTQSQAGKVMGLAPYAQARGMLNFFDLSDGELKPARQVKLERVGQLDDEQAVVDHFLTELHRLFGKPNRTEWKFNPMHGKMSLHSDPYQAKWQYVSAEVQRELERVYRWLVKQAVEVTGLRKVALAGGVALNCSANGMLIDQAVCDQLYVQPAAHDAGVALGAALYCSKAKSENFSPLLGPQYEPAAIREMLLWSGADFYEAHDLAVQTAEALSEGQTVCWFQGKAEFGPRALCARSILADPRSELNRMKVNSIKGRELWRPLAPSMTAERAWQYLLRVPQSRDMLERTYATENASRQIPAVVHCDNSLRPQLVDSTRQPLANLLLHKFEELSGVPVVLNTSFNTEREPIVCTPLDALRTFFERKFDLLAIGPFVVRKRS